ncbi:cytochrome P450 183B1 Cyp183B1 [Streptomyces albireticuli]|uniref:Cytochrome P450 183B1 Cyp183B1 n=1 Tax=Streptomyces albireticuli TaxID=1940 RepID=A0A1Z2KW32_9ACTN|nr:cytochrome P450 [Streptomyces albireticuli]ARZ66258.1 cytochrome P450 183B1 Cyp183B1 [Streptomyces albireticuli]
MTHHDRERAPDAGLRAGRAPGARPLTGHLARLYRAPLPFLTDLPRHGDLVEIRIGRRPFLVLCHPELARAVLTDDRTYDRDGPSYEGSRRAMGNGLATCPYADHRAQRHMLQPAFRPDHLERYAAVMRRTIAETVDGWRDGLEVDLAEELFALTTRTTVRALFASDLTPAAAQELHQALAVFLKGVYRQSLMPWAGRLPTPGNLRYGRALEQWRAQAGRLITAHRAGTPADARNVLSHLVAARTADGSPLPDPDVHDQVTALVLAGSETTAAALAWSCHLLTRHPGAGRRLREEARTVLGGRVATLEDVPRLTVTGRVLTEALRLYPPAWLVPRITTRETSLAGRRLPVGSAVVFCPYVLHRRADLYPEPHRFLPDRWAEGSGGGAAAARHRTYMPFGLGAHRCIGEAFALTEATMTLATLVARWELRPVPGAVVRPAVRAVLAPERLPVRLVAS